jgi:transposase
MGEVVYTCCCFLDVHAKTVVACLIREGKKSFRSFTTMTKGLLEMLDWLVGEGCRHVGIESTGVYWKPVFNILEGEVEVILVNPQFIKALKGKKSDKRDCERGAEKLRLGELPASFIPPREIRELRELTRYRSLLVREQTTAKNRIQKVLESGNIKLKEVISDVVGVSGTAMIEELLKGEKDTEKMAKLAKGSIVRKQEALQLALEGRLTANQRWVLGQLLEEYREVRQRIERVEQKIEETLGTEAYAAIGEAVSVLDTIPGVGRTNGAVIVAEVGIEMGQFDSAGHLASWAGMCPGENESAGKKLSGKTGKGNGYLRRVLITAAWAAASQKKKLLGKVYARLRPRLGAKKATVALAHRILTIVFVALSRKEPYREIVPPSHPMDPEKQKRQLVGKLETLGYKVTLTPSFKAA